MRQGIVIIAGAGPGPAEHLTVAVSRALQSADVVLFDALLAADVRQLAAAGSKWIYVGKRCGQHALKQEAINQLLIDFGRRGKTVVRLKGGDPFVFGRGSEEVETLRAAGIPYRVLPGISALNGIAALHTLPLTSRDQDREFRAIQGHNLPDSAMAWHDLAAYRGTLAIFMGTRQIGAIARRLLEHGGDRDKPIALIESEASGNTKAQRTTLGLAAKGSLKPITKGPGIIYIGNNVAFMDLVAPAQLANDTQDLWARRSLKEKRA